MDCIFCKIVKGEVPSYTIYEDETAKVFLDIEPSSDGHMLIIPKTHYNNIEDIDINTLNHMISIEKKMYKLLKEKLKVDGLTISQNNDYGQEVKHFHIHLTPRYNKDNVKIIYPNKRREIKEIYEILKNAK